MFLAQPQDAKAGATITSSRLLDGTSFVKVQLVDATTLAPVTNSKALVTFKLATGSGDAAGNLQVITAARERQRSGGVRHGHSEDPHRERAAVHELPADPHHDEEPADNWSSIGSVRRLGRRRIMHGRSRHLPGEPPGRERHLHPERCRNARCERAHVGPPGLVCPGQKTIFANTRVLLRDDRIEHSRCSSRTTSRKADWKASANNGQAHADWCIGLLDPWTAVGGPAVQKDTDGIGGADLYVGLAPKCPSANPSGIRAVHREPDRRRLGRQHQPGMAPGRRPAPPNLIS